MVAPLKWLLSYTDLNINSKEEIHELAEEMTLSGTKVEEVISKGAEINRVVVAKCLQVERHENSDHLFVCQLDIGAEEPIQIVTGAQNMRVGAYVPAALDNSTISEGRTIKAGKLREQYIDGEAFKILGHDHRLKVVQGKRNTVESDESYITLTVKDPSNVELKKKTMDKWLNNYCKEVS